MKHVWFNTFQINNYPTAEILDYFLLLAIQILSGHLVVFESMAVSPVKTFKASPRK